MKHIWVDLCHTPHVLFFKPIIEQLREEGHQVSITVRDCFQTYELAQKHIEDIKVIGKHYGKPLFFKIVGVVIRSLQLVIFSFNKKIDLAVNLGSPFQTIAAYLAGIPTIVISDYEYSNKTIFRLLACKIVVPEIIDNDTLNSLKIKLHKVKKFSGLKENVYLPHFQPDTSILKQLGLNPNKIIVTVRPPADKAHYHNENAEDFLTSILEYLRQRTDIQVVLLPRDMVQYKKIRKRYDGWIIVPEEPVDCLSLLSYSDAVFSGGGTVNREAATLGVPVYSFFQGKVGLVDKYLAQKRKLYLLNSKVEIQKLNIQKIRHKVSFRRIGDALPEVISIIKD